MKAYGSAIGYWISIQLFRIVTYGSVVGAYVYLWLYTPEKLKWWSRTSRWLIESGCDMLPAAVGNRMEPILGALGFLAQITIAVFILRVIIGLPLLITRTIWKDWKERP